MPTKPTEKFTCANDATFSYAGEADGMPTKVSPPGFPDCDQGLNYPGEPYKPEYTHKLFHICGKWITDWLDGGSSAGAADAHIVETDANGEAKVQVVETLRFVRQRYHHTINETWAHVGNTFPTDQAYWFELSTGANSGGDVVAGAPPRLRLTAGNTANDHERIYGDRGNVDLDRDNTFVLEFVARITGSIANVKIEFGAQSGSSDLTASSGQHGVAVSFDTGLADANWTLIGMAGTALTRSASGVAVAVDTWHRFRLEVAADGSAELFIDGASAATLAAGVVGANGLKPYFAITTLTAADRTCEIESVHAWQPPSA